ncbi:hypothetical protein ACGC1H_006500 [Rhizoctonia solani]
MSKCCCGNAIHNPNLDLYKLKNLQRQRLPKVYPPIIEPPNQKVIPRPKVLDTLTAMTSSDGDPSESFIGLQRLPEDIVRPQGSTILVNEGSTTHPPVPVAGNNISSNQVEPLVVPSNREQEGQPIESPIYSHIQVLDPMEHLRETILFKVSLASHKAAIGDDSSEDLSTRLEKLGKLYYNRFHEQGELDIIKDELYNIKQALVCYTCATFLAHPEHPKLPMRLERLGLLYITQFQYSRELQLQDHEMAAYYLNRSFDLAPESQSDPSRRLGLTALLHECRFWRTGNSVYSAKAIQDKTEVILKTHESSPELALRFESLGVLHEAQFQRTGQKVDIDKAIEYLTLAIKLKPDSPRRLENLGISYRTRSLHQASTTLSDIEQALKYLGLAVDNTPEKDEERPRRLTNLGVAWEARFRRLGDLQDNEKAIYYKQRAVALTARVDNHPDLPVGLESLAVSHETRFQRLGQLDDIEAAIQHLTSAVNLTPKADLARPRRLENLGTCYAARFEHMQRLEDSIKSIEYLARAVKDTPKSHTDLPRLLNNLGMAHKSRFEHDRDGGKEHIEKAIEYLTEALDITSRDDDHPDLPLRLGNLGVGYRTRFDPKIGSKLEDLEKAIEYGDDAVSRMPSNHAGLAKQLTNLGISHEMWYEQTKDYFHLSKALYYFRKAFWIGIAPPRERLKLARHCAKLLPHSTLPSAICLEAYRASIDLVPHVVLLGTNTRQRYHDLHQIRDLGVEAASMAIRRGKNDLALEWLEQTRCVVWNQTLLLRSEAPLDQLRVMYPHFESIDRLQQAIDQLYHSSLETDMSPTNIRTRSNLEEAPPSLLRTELIDVYNEIIPEVRKLPGFKDFMQPKRASELIGANRRGPIVVINCHNSGCDALITRPESNEITSVSLPGYTFTKAQSAYSTMKGSLVAKGMQERGAQTIRTERFEDVLAALWDKVVKPILTSLGYVTKNPEERLPHITWCPTGIMSFLPLHAAGDYKSQPPSRVFDYVISSYTPTLTAMPSPSSHMLANNCGIVAIGQSEAKPEHHLGPLPGTAKELAVIRGHTQDKLKYSQLVDSDATTEKVLEAMSQNDWVHLACHARQDVNDPAKSCFFLHESTLDLATIARQLFRNKGLAFLSACRTATGDDKLPDEAAHLASCMLVAGYPSVIASMWSVKDDDAPFVADHVYSHLMNCQSIANGEVARALHNAVAMLRKEVGMTNFDRWVQYIHMGL